MKKNLLTVLLGAFMCFGISSQANAQCASCTIDPSCMPAGGGLCPDSLPGATQGTPYVQDVTFYLPPQINVTSPINLGNVPLKKVTITNISGLPYGLTWQANNANKTYFPSNGENHGCVQICGTTFANAGTYNLTVNVDAVVAAGGVLGDQSGSQSFSFQMVVLPSTSGNAVFSYSPSAICIPGIVNFSPNINVNFPQVADYTWSFGNGNTSTVKNPPAQTYSSTGTVVASCTTTIYKLAITSLKVNVCNRCWWAGDVEELSCSNGNADIIPTINVNNVSRTLGEESNNCQPSWNISSNPIDLTAHPTSSTNALITISLLENDGASTDDVPPAGAYTAIVSAPGTYTFDHGGANGFAGEFVVSKILVNTLSANDTIDVANAPVIGALNTSGNLICSGDSILLTIDPGFNYRWVKNDTIELVETSNSIYVKSGGKYYVEVFDLASGCFTKSSTIVIDEYNLIPNFSLIFNQNTSALYPNIAGFYTYQWQKQNGANWVNIPAPLGVQSSYVPTTSGVYKLIISNGNCTNEAIYTLNGLSFEDYASLDFISIFPNPSNGVFNVKLDLNAETDVEIFIYDVSGRMLKAFDMQKYSGSTIIEINASDLNTGVYVVNTRLNGVDKNHRLVIQ